MRKKSLVLGAILGLGLLFMGAQTLYKARLAVGNLNSIRYVDDRTFTTIQAAIDDLPSTGGRVFVKDGDRTLTAILNVNKSVELVLGSGTITCPDALTALALVADTDSKCIFITASNVIMRGIPGQTVISSNVAVPANSGLSVYYDMILVSDDDIPIDNVHIKDMDLRLNITIPTTANAQPRFSALKFGNADANGVSNGGVNTGQLIANVSATGLDVKVTAPDTSDTQHKWYGLHAIGYTISSNLIENVRNVRFENNYFENSDGRQMQTYFVDGVIIKGNTFKDPNQSATENNGAHDIRVLLSDNVVVTGNVSIHGDVSNGPCIVMGGSTIHDGTDDTDWGERFIVSNNVCENNSTATNGGVAGFLSDGGIRDGSIVGNTFISYEADNDTAFGFRLDDTVTGYASKNILISGNRLSGWQQAQIRLDAGTSQIAVIGNFFGEAVGVDVVDETPSSNIIYNNASWNASSEMEVSTSKIGTEAPATCAIGELFYDTSAGGTNCTPTRANSLCVCSTTDTWTVVDDGPTCGTASIDFTTTTADAMNTDAATATGVATGDSCSCSINGGEFNDDLVYSGCFANAADSITAVVYGHAAVDPAAVDMYYCCQTP